MTFWARYVTSGLALSSGGDMDRSIILFEPYPYEERRGTWGRWKMGCDECGAYSASRLCFHCRKFLCVVCQGPVDEHLEWLLDLALQRLLTAE